MDHLGVRLGAQTLEGNLVFSGILGAFTTTVVAGAAGAAVAGVIAFGVVQSQQSAGTATDGAAASSVTYDGS